MRNEIQYYLGIDGGGTKTAFWLVDAQGFLCASCTLGPSNPNDIGLKEACALLDDGIAQVSAGYDRSVISCFAGVAGAATGENAALLTAHLGTRGFVRAECQSDLALSLAICLGEDDGIAIIMGTGALALGQLNGKVLRMGGYGYLFGDAGSGFALGQGAILAALKAEDGSGEQTLLHDMVADKCGKRCVLDALAKFYLGGKVEIARYAPLVFDAYTQGDAVATAILQDNVRAIAANIRTLGARMDKEHIRVVLCGGLVAKSHIVLPLLQDALAGDGRTYALSAAKQHPIQGALYLAGLR